VKSDPFSDSQTDSPLIPTQSKCPWRRQPKAKVGGEGMKQAGIADSARNRLRSGGVSLKLRIRAEDTLALVLQAGHKSQSHKYARPSFDQATQKNVRNMRMVCSYPYAQLRQTTAG